MRHVIMVTKDIIQLYTVDYNNLINIVWYTTDNIPALDYMLENIFGEGWDEAFEHGITKISKVVDVEELAIENRYTPNYDAIYPYIYITIDGMMYEIPVSTDALYQFIYRKGLPKEFMHVAFYMPFIKKTT